MMNAEEVSKQCEPATLKDTFFGAESQSAVDSIINDCLSEPQFAMDQGEMVIEHQPVPFLCSLAQEVVIENRAYEEPQHLENALVANEVYDPSGERFIGYIVESPTGHQFLSPTLESVSTDGKSLIFFQIFLLCISIFVSCKHL